MLKWGSHKSTCRAWRTQQRSSAHRLPLWPPLVFFLLLSFTQKRRPGCLRWFITRSECWCVGVAKTCSEPTGVCGRNSARVATFPRIVNFSKQGRRQWFFVSDCALTFLQRRIAGVWREHLLKAFQKFQKIEADATLSTLCESSVWGQAILSASLRTWNMQRHFLFVDWDLIFFWHPFSGSRSFWNVAPFFIFLPLFVTTVDLK